MKTRFLFLVFSLTLVSTSFADEWQFGSFSIQWEDGYHRIEQEGIDQFSGPDGTVVTVDALGTNETDPKEISKIREGLFEYAITQFPALISRHGKLTLPLKRENLDSGIVRFTIAGYDEANNACSLIFFFVSPAGRAAQVAVDSHGRAEVCLSKFQKFSDTAKWSLPSKKQNK